jgi:hypothetical protein
MNDSEKTDTRTSRHVSFLTCIQTIRSEWKGQKHWREVWSATPPSPLLICQVHSTNIDKFVARVSFLTCIQGIRSERKGQKRWREVWSTTPPSPLSICHVHSADMDAFHARVISHVYSDNQIRMEGAEALARSLERNSSLTSLHLRGTSLQIWMRSAHMSFLTCIQPIGS